MRKLRTTPDDSETIVHKKGCKCELCEELRPCDKCGGETHIEENNTTYKRVCDDCGARATETKSNVSDNDD